MRNPARFVDQTGRSCIICMSTSAFVVRASMTTHTAPVTAAMPRSPIVRADAHPHCGASLMPSKRHTSQHESSEAPSQSTEPGARMGDSGIRNFVATTVAPMTTARDPEEPVVAQVVDDRPGEHDAEATADPEQTRDERDPACYSLPRELVADDPKCQWEHRAANALDRPGCDQHGKRRRERGDQRAASQSRHHDEQRALLSEHVTEATGDRR